MSPLKRNTLASQHNLVIKLLNITYKYAPASNDTRLSCIKQRQSNKSYDKHQFIMPRAGNGNSAVTHPKRPLKHVNKTRFKIKYRMINKVFSH